MWSIAYQRPLQPKDIINTVPIWAAWCMTSGIRCRLVARVGVVWNLVGRLRFNSAVNPRSSSVSKSAEALYGKPRLRVVAVGTNP